MSKGSIKDFRVRVVPSPGLIKIISELHDCIEMPENVIKIYEAETGEKGKKKILTDIIPKQNIEKFHKEILDTLKIDEQKIRSLKEALNFEGDSDYESDDIENIGSESNSKDEHDKKPKQKQSIKKKQRKDNYILYLNDLRWINKILIEKRSNESSEDYLHELLQGSKLLLPKNEIIPRSPELEARCQKLREQQKAREYRKMTKDVDTTRKMLPDESIGYQIKSINRQLIAVLQFIFSVAAGFAFGFIGIELSIGNVDFGFRLLLGIICALIIALAEIYFLAKKLNEYEDYPEEFPKEQRKVHQD